MGPAHPPSPRAKQREAAQQDTGTPAALTTAETPQRHGPCTTAPCPWLDQATPPTLPPGLPLRRNNRLLALYSHNGRWDLRVILAQPRGGHRPFVARGVYTQVLYEPTNTALPEGPSLQATPLGPATSAPRIASSWCGTMETGASSTGARATSTASAGSNFYQKWRPSLTTNATSKSPPPHA